jgi:hypothetical protein
LYTSVEEMLVIGGREAMKKQTHGEIEKMHKRASRKRGKVRERE